MRDSRKTEAGDHGGYQMRDSKKTEAGDHGEPRRHLKIAGGPRC